MLDGNRLQTLIKMMQKLARLQELDVNSSSEVGRGCSYRFYKVSYSIKNSKGKVFPDFKTRMQVLRNTCFPE